MDKSTAQVERKMSFCHPKGGLLQDKRIAFAQQKAKRMHCKS